LKAILAISFILVLLGNSVIFASYAQQEIQSPLKQFQSGIALEDVKCNNGFQLIGKSNDGSPACVTSDTFTKLIDWGWGYDPSKQVVILNIKDTYKTKEQINFIMKYNVMIGVCTEPSVFVNNQTNQTIWKSNIIAVPCPPVLTTRYAHGQMNFGNSELGYLQINQTGSYYIHVWFAKEAVKRITITD
jgi:hypothetical protein